MSTPAVLVVLGMRLVVLLVLLMMRLGPLGPRLVVLELLRVRLGHFVALVMLARTAFVVFAAAFAAAG
ncbi:MAG: hypothetical protein WDO13_15955 [Verrucomicrobiota bacterium]